MGIIERIKDIEVEIARTQKNKATNSHLMRLRAQLAKLRTEVRISLFHVLDRLPLRTPNTRLPLPASLLPVPTQPAPRAKHGYVRPPSNLPLAPVDGSSFSQPCCRLITTLTRASLSLNSRTVRAPTTSTPPTTTAAAQQWQERGRRGRGRWRGDGGRQPRVRGGAVRGRARVSHRLPQRWQVLPPLQADGHQVRGRRVRVHHAHGHSGEPVPQGVQDPAVGPSWDHRGGGVRERARAAGKEEDNTTMLWWLRVWWL